MKRITPILRLVLVLSLTLVVAAQLPQKNESSSDPGQQLDPDRFEAAHSQLLSGQDKAAEASRLTESVSGVLPGTGAPGPVVRKNFIDEFIFGRMERDK